ncbi:hypothetical protein E2C01_028201 [Portunus trituberculatus]|uniref:Uncharacterized protein n=1 Tax=Portunus trituberculatus TaxID=210409 RepID=A0A5B7EJV5_PORTR|nr:hypothetical protein [Portunus trituberculatus]
MKPHSCFIDSVRRKSFSQSIHHTTVATIATTTTTICPDQLPPHRRLLTKVSSHPSVYLPTDLPANPGLLCHSFLSPSFATTTTITITVTMTT